MIIRHIYTDAEIREMTFAEWCSATEGSSNIRVTNDSWWVDRLTIVEWNVTKGRIPESESDGWITVYPKVPCEP